MKYIPFSSHLAWSGLTSWPFRGRCQCRTEQFQTTTQNADLKNVLIVRSSYTEQVTEKWMKNFVCFMYWFLLIWFASSLLRFIQILLQNMSASHLDPDSSGDYDRRTPLHLACASGNHGAVEATLETDALILHSCTFTFDYCFLLTPKCRSLKWGIYK